MSRDLRPDGVETASPPASRQRRQRWRDPRLWLGALLVLGSVALGARVLASADDTVDVWQVAHDVPAGTIVGPADLQVTKVHFDQASVAGHYLLASRPIAPGTHATRDLQAAELLESSAVSALAAPATRQLPLGVGAAHQPADLRPGDRVDVWAVPAPTGGATGQPADGPALVLHDVVVLSVDTGTSGLSGERQVLVAIGARVDVGSVLGRMVGAQVVLVRLAG